MREMWTLNVPHLPLIKIILGPDQVWVYKSLSALMRFATHDCPAAQVGAGS